MTSNDRLAADLDMIADLLELTGANPFRVRAYRTAAKTVQELPAPLGERVAAGEDPSELPGVGKEIAAQLSARLAGEPMPRLRELAAAVPPGLLQVVKVPGVGPGRARRLWQELGVDGLPALREAANEGRIRALKGFGERSERRIAEGSEQVERFAARTRRFDALRQVTPVVERLQQHRAVVRIATAGSLRRGRDTVADVDVVVASEDGEAVIEAVFAADPEAERLARGSEKASLRLASGLQLDVRVVAPSAFGAALQYFTGSQAHNVRLRRRAKDAGLSLNEFGLWRGGSGATDDGRSGERVAGEDEESLYDALGLAWIPPELREDRGEIEAAAEDALPRLVRLEDVRTDLHAHSDWSDGSASVEAMARAARAAGLSVLAITDHGPTLRMTGGLTAERLERQADAILAAREAVPEVTLLRGVECDVLADGSLDLPDELLARLDLVVASVHTRMDLDEAQQTERVVRALTHPEVNVLAHPTGRLLGRREGMRLDLHAVIQAAAAHTVALEINANPARLDLNDRWARTAIQAGVRLSVASDAHTPDDFALLRHGVLQARRAWATPEDVIGAWPLPRLRRFLAKEASDAA